MKTSDIIDTIECRKKIVEFFEYLDKGNELPSENFIEEIFSSIITDTSIESYQSRSSALSQTLVMKMGIKQMSEENNSEEELQNQFQILRRFNMICILECMKGEIRNNYCRIDAIMKNPIFANAVATGKIKAVWSIQK